MSPRPCVQTTSCDLSITGMFFHDYLEGEYTVHLESSSLLSVVSVCYVSSATKPIQYVLITFLMFLQHSSILRVFIYLYVQSQTIFPFQISWVCLVILELFTLWHTVVLKNTKYANLWTYTYPHLSICRLIFDYSTLIVLFGRSFTCKCVTFLFLADGIPPVSLIMCLV